MINTHGLKMVGLKKASSATVNWSPRSGGYTQISYDLSNGNIYINDHIGQSWSEYHDDDVITVCHAKEHMTMQQIADAIYDAVTQEPGCTGCRQYSVKYKRRGQDVSVSKCAKDALAAIEALCDQFGWTYSPNYMIDADTHGHEWAEVKADTVDCRRDASSGWDTIIKAVLYAGDDDSGGLKKSIKRKLRRFLMKYGTKIKDDNTYIEHVSSTKPNDELIACISKVRGAGYQESTCSDGVVRYFSPCAAHGLLGGIIED